MKNLKNKKPGIAIEKKAIPKNLILDGGNEIPVTPTQIVPGAAAIGSRPTLNIKNEFTEKFIQSDHTLNLILSAALDAIICMDTNGNIIFWNPQAEIIFGWNKQDATGAKLSELIIPEQYHRRHKNLLVI